MSIAASTHQQPGKVTRRREFSWADSRVDFDVRSFPTLSVVPAHRGRRDSTDVDPAMTVWVAQERAFERPKGGIVSAARRLGTSFVASAVFNAALLLVAAFMVLTYSAPSDEPDVVASLATEQEPPPRELQPENQALVSVRFETAAATIPDEAGRTKVGQLPEFLPLRRNGAATLRDSLPENIGMPLGEDGAGMTDKGDGHGGGAEFFGVSTSGSRFVFVVDRSTSMIGVKFDDARQEVYDAVRRLGPDKEFYVIFFAGDTTPMFSVLNPEPELLPATDENVDELDAWMRNVGLNSWTDPFVAIQLALRFKPDAIYLLTDGEFTAPRATESFLRHRIEKYLKRENLDYTSGKPQAKVTIHTIGFYTTNTRGAAALRAIANRHGGEYRYVSREKWQREVAGRKP